MASPEVKYLLDAIETNATGYGVGGYGMLGYGSSTLADIPLERIDRDNADNLDTADGVASLSGPIHRHAEELTGMNYVEARSVSTTDSVLDTDYNVDTERVVGVRLEGAHISESGAIDPQAGTDTASSVAWPTIRWHALKRTVRLAIYTERITPTPDRANVAYKDLFVENVVDSAAEYSDYYRWDADIRLVGFEELP